MEDQDNGFTPTDLGNAPHDSRGYQHVDVHPSHAGTDWTRPDRRRAEKAKKRKKKDKNRSPSPQYLKKDADYTPPRKSQAEGEQYGGLGAGGAMNFQEEADNGRGFDANDDVGYDEQDQNDLNDKNNYD